MIEGAQKVVRRFGQYDVENLTQLGYFTSIKMLLDEAIVNGSHRNVMAETEERETFFLLAAGAMLLALQHYGAKTFTTHELHRNLHSQQTVMKGLLLEQEFIRSEAGDAFRRCYDAAKTGGEFNAEDWQKLSFALRKLALDV